MESPDIRKLRKQIREMRSSQKVGTPINKMSTEELQHEIDYHNLAARSMMYKARRTKAAAPEKEPVKPKRKPAVKKEVEYVPTRASPKRKPSRAMKAEDTDDIIQVDENLDLEEPKIKPTVKKTAAKIIRELPELKKNVKKNQKSEEAAETPVARLLKTTLSLRRPYVVENEEVDDSEDSAPLKKRK